MSDTTNTTAAAPLPDANAPAGIIATIESYVAEVSHWAANLFAEAKAVEADVTAFDAAHPEVLAAATTLENMAPPEVRAGINTAEKIAEQIQHIAVQAEEAKATVAATASPAV